MAEPGAPGDGMAASDSVLARRRARLRRRRRRLVVVGVAGAVVAGGAGSAWAMRGSDGPAYRLATVRAATVEQTVGADGSLAARRSATAAFAAAGTVASVGVAVGDKVTAGQTLATLDPTSLDAAVTAAETKLAQAKQQLADDEDAQANGTTVTATTTRTTATANFTSFTTTTTRAPSGGGMGTLAAAQQAVVTAQRTLDTAIKTQDDLVATLVTVCKASGDTSSVPASADSDGTVAGTAAGAVVVTLLNRDGGPASTTSQNPQTFTSGGRYTFAGLTASTGYTVQLVRTGVADASRCAQQAATVGTQQQRVNGATSSLATALAALTKAVTAQPSGSSTSGSTGGTTGGSGTTGSDGSGGSSGSSGSNGSSGSSKSSGSPGSTGSTGSASTGVAVTAERIAADQKAIDAARADVAVAESNRTHATLTTPMAGTVAAVAIAKGDAVSAGSSSSTITVVGTGALAVDVSISLADIDLVRAGQSAKITVDGQSGALPATVTYVGQTNSSSSTGSSSAYTVSVQLAQTYPSLYDGMGAEVSIAVGYVANAVTVPVSAVQATGARHTVSVYAAGKITTQSVTLGLVGDSLAQVKTGLKAGQQVVLADLGAAIPSSNTSNRRGGSALTGLSGGGAAGGPRGGPGGAGPP